MNIIFISLVVHGFNFTASATAHVKETSEIISGEQNTQYFRKMFEIFAQIGKFLR